MVVKEPSSDRRGSANLPIPEIGTPLPPMPLIVADVIFRSVIKLESFRTMRLAARSTTYLTLSVSATKHIGS